LHPATKTLDKANPKSLLELADLEADRRLCQVEPCRRRGEAAELDRYRKSFELIEVEATHLPKNSLMEIIDQTNFSNRCRCVTIGLRLERSRK
jgi:hypothetical protein